MKHIFFLFSVTRRLSPLLFISNWYRYICIAIIDENMLLITTQFAWQSSRFKVFFSTKVMQMMHCKQELLEAKSAYFLWCQFANMWLLYSWQCYTSCLHLPKHCHKQSYRVYCFNNIFYLHIWLSIFYFLSFFLTYSTSFWSFYIFFYLLCLSCIATPEQILWILIQILIDWHWPSAVLFWDYIRLGRGS